MRYIALDWVVGVAVVLFLASPGFASAENEPELLYRRYCGSCHGPSGKGDGVASSFMRPMPPDLTQLASQAGGEFPFLKVMKVIDGRETPRAHGDSEMPVWGEILSRDAAGADHAAGAEVENRLMLITEHIRSLQER